MKNRESRRIVPISIVTAVVFVLVVAFELLVIGGAVDVKASTIARLAPWAYEPFLKLVGEHPDSKVHSSVPSGLGAMKPSAMEVVASFETEAPSSATDTNAMSGTNAVTRPSATEQQVETSSTNEPAPSEPTPEQVEPVG